MACGKNIMVMNCPNWVCGEDNLLCKECGGKLDVLEKEGEQ